MGDGRASAPRSRGARVGRKSPSAHHSRRPSVAGIEQVITAKRLVESARFAVEALTETARASTRITFERGAERATEAGELGPCARHPNQCVPRQRAFERRLEADDVEHAWSRQECSVKRHREVWLRRGVELQIAPSDLKVRKGGERSLRDAARPCARGNLPAWHDHARVPAGATDVKAKIARGIRGAACPGRADDRPGCQQRRNFHGNARLSSRDMVRFVEKVKGGVPVLIH